MLEIDLLIEIKGLIDLRALQLIALNMRQFIVRIKLDGSIFYLSFYIEKSPFGERREKDAEGFTF